MAQMEAKTKRNLRCLKVNIIWNEIGSVVLYLYEQKLLATSLSKAKAEFPHTMNFFTEGEALLGYLNSIDLTIHIATISFKVQTLRNCVRLMVDTCFIVSCWRAETESLPKRQA